MNLDHQRTICRVHARMEAGNGPSDASDASDGAMERVFRTKLASWLLVLRWESMDWTPLNPARFAEQDSVVWVRSKHGKIVSG